MRYPVLIEVGGASTAWGVVVPDLPGCFSAGDTQEEAIANTAVAIRTWIEVAQEAGQAIPAPSTIETLQAVHPVRGGWVWGLLKVAPGGAGQPMSQ